MVVLQEHPDLRDAALRRELVERIACVLHGDGSAEPIPGLHVHRVSQPNERLHSVYQPSLCVIA